MNVLNDDDRVVDDEPMATAMPPIDMTLMDPSSSHTKRNVETTVMGSVEAATRVSRQFGGTRGHEHREQAADRDRFANVGDRGLHELREVIGLRQVSPAGSAWEVSAPTRARRGS